MKNNNRFAVIMAGGVGSRFWPVSTAKNPKQFHDMLGTGKSLLQQTFSRLQRIVPESQILVLTNEAYVSLVADQLPAVSAENIIAEPAMRNTAPCILFAALKIRLANPDAVFIVAPSDHFIENESAFTSDVDLAMEYASREDVLLTLGIVPTFPNTGFGYIESGENLGAFKRVKQFREKPDLQTAQQFLAAGNFYWNAGIFVWSARSVLSAFEKYQPEMARLFSVFSEVQSAAETKATLAEIYPQAANISIDYAVMEPAHNVVVLPASFDWNDLGTWGALYEKLPKDEQNNAVVNARLLTKESNGNVVSTTSNKRVVVKGLSNFMIVETSDTILIYPLSDEQSIKEISAEAERL